MFFHWSGSIPGPPGICGGLTGFVADSARAMASEIKPAVAMGGAITRASLGRPSARLSIRSMALRESAETGENPRHLDRERQRLGRQERTRRQFRPKAHDAGRGKNNATACQSPREHLAASRKAGRDRPLGATEEPARFLVRFAFEIA